MFTAIVMMNSRSRSRSERAGRARRQPRELVGDDGSHRVLRVEERRETCGLLPMTIVTAIVSPRARPKPSMIAPRIPLLPKPSATLIASHRVAPRAYAASRWVKGTFFRISRATDDENGTTMIARISAAFPCPRRGADRRTTENLQWIRYGQFELPHDRRQHEDAPEAIDDRRNRREQLRQVRQRLPQKPRRELGDEDRDAERDRRGDDQRQDRRVECSPDERQRAEFSGHRIPYLVVQKCRPNFSIESNDWRVSSKPIPMTMSSTTAAKAAVVSWNMASSPDRGTVGIGYF